MSRTSLDTRSARWIVRCLALCSLFVVASCTGTRWRGTQPSELRPIDLALVRELQPNEPGSQSRILDGTAYVVEETRHFTLSEATYSTDDYGNVGVGFDVHPKDQKALESWTQQNTGRTIGVLLGDELIYAAKLNDPLRNGVALYWSRENHSEQLLHDLMRKLNATNAASP